MHEAKGLQLDFPGSPTPTGLACSGLGESKAEGEQFDLAFMLSVGRFTLDSIQF